MEEAFPSNGVWEVASTLTVLSAISAYPPPNNRLQSRRMNMITAFRGQIMKLKRLATAPQIWPTARATSCGLFHIAYATASVILQNELKKLYVELCRDPSNRVREAAAVKIGTFAATIERTAYTKSCEGMFSSKEAIGATRIEWIWFLPFSGYFVMMIKYSRYQIHINMLFQLDELFGVYLNVLLVANSGKIPAFCTFAKLLAS
uniref:Uncharacterized protein n=1 Tax=Solanum lycopersicum TaxID=4081 RepID=K4BMT8_SOLLC